MGASRGSGLRTFWNSWMASIEQSLVARRDEQRISQTATAQMIGVSQPAIAKLESGRARNVEINPLVRYAAALGGRLKVDVVREPRARWGAPRRRTRAR